MINILSPIWNLNHFPKYKKPNFFILISYFLQELKLRSINYD